MKYLFSKSKPRDECGVYGVYNHNKAANLTALGLHALQHRGQDSAGIVTSNNQKFFAHRGMGQVSDVFSNKEIIPKLIGRLSIGHNLSLIHI